MSKNKNNTQQTSFWRFLHTHKVDIPIIQRDYAQGRIGKEKLREKFLADLKKALDDKKVLKLDFIYGGIENDRMHPLDGQQRLTTLWLLHWYIAFKAGKLAEVKDILKHFTYETRVSSREFCEKLCDSNLNSDGIIVEQIQNQTWFYSSWKQDPTIQAMLHMLGGTKILDDKGVDIPDGVEEVFGKCNFFNFWEKLISDDCPIIFYYLDLMDLSLSDDLYIKMNARGKPLTSFENFKADLVGYIKEKKWEEERNPQDTIAHKLDTTWTNIFWKYKSPEHKIDESYFTFLKRYYINGLITAKKADNYRFTAEKLEQSECFKDIWNLKSEYTSFDVFKPKEGDEDIFGDNFYTRLECILDNFHAKLISKDEINELFYPEWEKNNSDFRFIPEYIEFKETNEVRYKLTSINQTQRIIFHAICCYLESIDDDKNKYDEIRLKQWMRVVWNIVENAGINGIQPMIGAMRLIDEIGEHSHDIYTWLANDENKITSKAASDQVKEERVKARLIINDTANVWKNKIIEAEQQPFFKGRIKYLLEAAEDNFEKFNYILKLCEVKIVIDNVETLKHYLTFIDLSTLPLRCEISDFNGWKDILYHEASIKYFRNNLEPTEVNENWSDWKKALVTDFDEINPLKWTIKNYCKNGYDSNDVFAYVSSNISSAKLLSSNRKSIIEKLRNTILRNDYPLYPRSNELGNLRIEQEYFTDDFKEELKSVFNDKCDDIRLLINKNLYLKNWKDRQSDVNCPSILKIQQSLVVSH